MEVCIYNNVNKKHLKVVANEFTVLEVMLFTEQYPEMSLRAFLI